jgi:hypothetical protein
MLRTNTRDQAKTQTNKPVPSAEKYRVFYRPPHVGLTPTATNTSSDKPRCDFEGLERLCHLLPGGHSQGLKAITDDGFEAECSRDKRVRSRRNEE